MTLKSYEIIPKKCHPYTSELLLKPAVYIN